MKPDVNQHLQGMCKAMQEIVLPELADKPFAHEQASLILATLNLLAEVQEHQFAYARQEFADIRCLLGAWHEDHPDSADASLRMDFPDLPRAAGDMPLGELRDRVTHEKSRLRRLMDGEPLPRDSRIHALLERYIERQLARETAWLRKTGFIPNGGRIPHVSTVLEQQARHPLQP